MGEVTEPCAHESIKWIKDLQEFRCVACNDHVAVYPVDRCMECGHSIPLNQTTCPRCVPRPSAPETAPETPKDARCATTGPWGHCSLNQGHSGPCIEHAGIEIETGQKTIVSFLPDIEKATVVMSCGRPHPEDSKRRCQQRRGHAGKCTDYADRIGWLTIVADLPPDGGP